jgi:hypothetical protein
MTIIDFLALLVPITGFGCMWLTLRYIKKIRLKRKAKQFKDKMEQAIEKITEDGVVEGPKGKYVPHKKWDKTSYKTPSSGQRHKGGIL